jgi:serine phosphatase RsbU (regulator of sigma subunit)
MGWSPDVSGKHDELVEQRLATLQDENRRLSEQIKRLVRTEHELYQFQGQLDDQIRIYRHLYEVGKKLNATLDLGELLQVATQFVLYQLNFERCVALLYDPEAKTFYVEAHDGYYDEASQARLTALRFPADDHALALIFDQERVICAEGCDQDDLLALGQVLEMAEYVAFPLGGEPQRPIGLLIAGNTVNSAAYHPHIQADSEYVVGLANLVSQVATAIRMRREIQARERRLKQEAHARERIEQELHVARRIQQASLPEAVPELEGWQISPFYRSAREVGGDFYDFHHLSEGRLGLVVGDATGKGVPAALVMSTTCGMLQVTARALESSSPGEVLERVNEALFARIPPNMFVTCFYAILDPKSGYLVYANAGHDLPYLHRNGDAEELRARGMPLGLMPGMGYEEGEATIREGYGVLFYSDGLVEAHDLKGEMFGFPRLRALVAKHGEEKPLVDFLMEELRSFTGDGWEQEDDITLVALRRSAQ